MNILKKHKRHFPDIGNLYDYQDETSKRLLNGNNTLSIVPTGGGKSLIFQLAALELPGMTIVISPLVALMQEQVNELQKNGVNSLAFNGTISFQDQRKILRNLANSKIKLLYLSPERLYNTLFREALVASGIQVSLLVIDEAHCISQWGNDFRPEYSQIKPFHNYLSQISTAPLIFALTATLGKNERDDIVREFGITGDSVFIHKGIIRDNLYLNFKKVDKETDKVEAVLEFLEKYRPKKVLVYLYSRRLCEDYADRFISEGLRADYFHSGSEFDDGRKMAVYESFKAGEIDILFATTAFGMGINIPDIDAVIHLQNPNSVEEYYQHVGRGARNTNLCPNCNCLVLYSDTNIARRKEWIEAGRVDKKKLNDAYGVFGFEDQGGNVVGKDYYEYKNVKGFNLPMVRYYLEAEDVISWIGEVNGTPLTIRFKEENPKWESYTKGLDGFDSFEYASLLNKISIPEIIQFIYSEEMKGHIEYLSAKKKLIFFEVKYDVIPNETVNKIVKQINSVVDYKQQQFLQFEELLSTPDPRRFIKNVLQV